MPLTEILTKTWETWEEFDTEYDAWRRSYEASPSAAGQFFKGGEILPDGSTIIESPNFETITIDYNNDTSTIVIVEPEIPRTRMDMKNLMEYDLQTDTKDDIKGTYARKHAFFKSHVEDMEKAKEETVYGKWVSTFRKLSDYFKNE